jgi:hypothetical protein
MKAELELHDGSRWTDYAHDHVLVTVGRKDGTDLVRVIECKLHSDGEVEALKVTEAWDEDGQDVPVQPEVPKDIATWVSESREVLEDLDRLFMDEY